MSDRFVSSRTINDALAVETDKGARGEVRSIRDKSMAMRF
jgi:hypothetical protein